MLAAWKLGMGEAHVNGRAACARLWSAMSNPPCINLVGGGLLPGKHLAGRTPQAIERGPGLRIPLPYLVALERRYSDVLVNR